MPQMNYFLQGFEGGTVAAQRAKAITLRQEENRQQAEQFYARMQAEEQYRNALMAQKQQADAAKQFSEDVSRRFYMSNLRQIGTIDQTNETFFQYMPLDHVKAIHGEEMDKFGKQQMVNQQLGAIRQWGIANGIDPAVLGAWETQIATGKSLPGAVWEQITPQVTEKVQQDRQSIIDKMEGMIDPNTMTDAERAQWELGRDEYMRDGQSGVILNLFNAVRGRGEEEGKVAGKIFDARKAMAESELDTAKEMAKLSKNPYTGEVPTDIQQRVVDAQSNLVQVYQDRLKALGVEEETKSEPKPKPTPNEHSHLSELPESGGGAKPSAEQRIDQLIGEGRSKDEIRQILAQEGYE